MKKFIAPLVVGTALLPVQPVYAQAEFFNTLVQIGGALAINEINRQNSQPKTSSQPQSPNSQANAALREQRREIQRRLNMLGYNVGTPDGLFGPRTNAGITAFQAAIGEAPTGSITEAQIVRLYQLTSPDGGLANIPTPSSPVGVVPAPVFPSLPGGPETGQPAPVAGFPALNAPGQPAPGAFPQLGGAAAGQPATPGGPAFPALGDAQAAGSAPATGFPALGDAQTVGSAPTTGFPALGDAQAPGSAPTTSFPARGNAQTAGSAPATGFPPLGAPQAPNAAPASGFPALATNPATDQPVDNVGSFPALGTPVAPTAESATSFPSLSEPEDTTETTPVAGFPPLSSSSGDGAAAAEGFPTLGEAPQPAPGGFPTLDASAPTSTEIDLLGPVRTEQLKAQFDPLQPGTYSLAANLAKTPFGNLEGQPAILGVSLGQDRTAAVALLNGRGITDCTDDAEREGLTLCFRETANFLETIGIAADGEDAIWLLERTVAFNAPMSVSVLREQMADAYGSLLSTGFVSVEDCSKEQVFHAARTNWVDMAEANSLEQLTGAPDVVAAAIACPLVFSLDLPATGTVDQFRIAFTDMSSHLERLIASHQASQEDAQVRMQEISEELDF